MKKIIGMLVGLMMAGCGGNVIVDRDCDPDFEENSQDPCISCDQMLHDGFDLKNDVNFCPNSFLYWEKVESFICNSNVGKVCAQECLNMFCTNSSTPDYKCTDCIVNKQIEGMNDAFAACADH